MPLVQSSPADIMYRSLLVEIDKRMRAKGDVKSVDILASLVRITIDYELSMQLFIEDAGTEQDR